MSSLGRVSYPSIEIDGDHGSAGIRAMITKNTLVALTLLLAASRVSLAAENPLMGTWKLNESKSKYASDSAKNTTVTYTAAKGDMIKCTAGGVDKDGKPIHWTWTGKLDGKPYPIKGSPAFDTLAYHPMNERSTFMSDPRWKTDSGGVSHGVQRESRTPRRAERDTWRRGVTRRAGSRRWTGPSP